MKQNLRYYIILCCLLNPFTVFSQGADVPLNYELYHIVDRIDILGLTDTLIHTDWKPYSQQYVADLFKLADTTRMKANEREWYHRQRLLWDDEYAEKHIGKGFLKYFYRNGRDFYHHHSKNFKVYINPLLYLSAGGEFHDETGESQSVLNYRNTRGLQIRGSLHNKLGFFTEVTENQTKGPSYVVNSFNNGQKALYGEGFIKQFEGIGFDYFNAKGYLTYSPIKNMRFKLGKDRAFSGNGYQSLFLSDYATDYYFLNIVTRIWKFEYVNHFAQMLDFIPGKPDAIGTHPKKYSVFHQLSFKPIKELSISIFESVVYSPILPGSNRGFELEYLNPVIFYRSLEQYLGSPDNAMIGLSMKLNLFKHLQTYGQIMVDDYNFRNRTLGKGFHGNKYGIQIGAKYIDAFGISRLDLQMEYNRLRPYAYSHFNPAAAYTHYGQYLAHSFGANLHDINFIARYQPYPAWHLTGTITYLQKGLDKDGINYGGDPFQSYLDRYQNFNNTVGQGEKLNVLTVYGKLSYQILKLNAYMEVEGRYRNESSYSSLTIMGSLRWSLPVKPLKF